MLHDLAPSLAAGTWQAWVQPAAVLVSVAAASAWLTVRWLRRRSGCAGDCSRCTAHEPGARTCAAPTRGVRPPGLQVLQGPTNLPRSGDV